MEPHPSLAPTTSPDDRLARTSTPSDGRAARASRQRAETHARLLHHAAELFAARGFADTGIGDLLAAADVSRGTFYAHFDSKEAVLGAILEDFARRLAATLSPVTTRSAAEAHAELLANIERALALLDASPAPARILLSRDASLPPELVTHLDRLLDAASALLLRALDAGVALGVVRPGDNALRARLILGAFLEALRPDPRVPPRSPSDDPARRALALAMLDFGLAGVLVPGFAPPTPTRSL
jgi:AcrR family transcriptional regulator